MTATTWIALCLVTGCGEIRGCRMGQLTADKRGGRSSTPIVRAPNRNPPEDQGNGTGHRGIWVKILTATPWSLHEETARHMSHSRGAKHQALWRCARHQSPRLCRPRSPRRHPLLPATTSRNVGSPTNAEAASSPAVILCRGWRRRPRQCPGRRSVGSRR
jgi:hypothetical protein